MNFPEYFMFSNPSLSDSLRSTGGHGERGPADTESFPQDGCHTPGACSGTKP